MPIDTPHPLYAANIAIWRRCRAVYLGGDAIRAGGYEYLPQLDADQSNAEYHSYMSRPTFFEATGRTIDGFVGAISRKPHRFTLPSRIASMESDATSDGISLQEITKSLCAEVLLQGRVGLLVDIHDELKRPFLSIYNAENIICWNDDMVVLYETVYEKDAVDEFRINEINQYRQLWVKDGEYTATVWRKKKEVYGFQPQWEVYSEVKPIVPGEVMTRIPFTFITPLGPTSRIEKPPLLGLVELNLEHFRKSADLSHGLHFAGIPTIYVTGVQEYEQIGHLGVAAYLVIRDANAKVGYAEFKGQGLGAIERAVLAIEQRMAAMGASVLVDAARRSNETALAAGIRHNSETNILAATVSAVQAGLTIALNQAAYWARATGPVEVELNDDFSAARMDAQTLSGLVQAYQAGAITIGLLQQALADGELISQSEVETKP